MKKVLILFGGNSLEHEVSCNSARGIAKNIDYRHYEVTICGIDFFNNWFVFDDDIDKLNENWLTANIINVDNIIEFLRSFDVVFPIIHGYGGEDGKLEGMLDLFDINYVGTDTLGSAIGMDKDITKKICASADIPQVPYMTIREKEKYVLNCEKYLGYPVIVKPSCGGSSIGISVCHNRKELMKAVKKAFKIDDKVVIEKFIKARELECGILEKNDYEVSVVGEIKSVNEFYDYEAKYIKDSELIIPACINSSVENKIKAIAYKIAKTLNVSSLARIDFLYDEDNDIVYFNEINTLPGFTDISMYPRLFEYMGISFRKLITLLIENC